MRRPSAVVGVLLLACAACRPAAVPVTQDLMALRTGFEGGAPVPLRTAAGAPRDGDRELDIYVRLPADAELRYRLPDGQSPAAVQLAELIDGTVTPLAPTADGGEWRAPLSAGDGEIAALRLTTTAGQSVALVAPRIVGRTAPAPAPLPRRRRPGGRLPNVILYVVDTLRTDRMSLYDYGRPTTPELDRLARDAWVFEQAYAAGSFTSPSVTALLSSRRASELQGALRPDGAARTTLAEAFHAAGYATAAFQANLLCTPANGYDRGFERYELVGTITKDGLGKATAGELHDRALDWVRAHRDRPFFLYLQSMDVHFPYAPPAPFRGLFEKPMPPGPPPAIAPAVDAEAARVFKERLAALSPDRYDGAIAYADMELARLFAALETMGLADDTIVILTADHGEPLGDRKEIFHGRSLWNELVRVPLVVWVPWLAGGRRVDEVVSLLDVGPTLVDLAGVGLPASFAGRSLLAPSSRAQPPGAVGELVRGKPYGTIGWYAREGPWKLILDAKQGATLFHIPTDPGETRDVSAAHPALVRYLTGRATAMPPPPGEAVPAAAPPPALSEEDRRKRLEALEALGYVETP